MRGWKLALRTLGERGARGDGGARGLGDGA